MGIALFQVVVLAILGLFYSEDIFNYVKVDKYNHPFCKTCLYSIFQYSFQEVLFSSSITDISPYVYTSEEPYSHSLFRPRIHQRWAFVTPPCHGKMCHVTAFDKFFEVSLNMLFEKQPHCWWFEVPCYSYDLNAVLCLYHSFAIKDTFPGV